MPGAPFVASLLGPEEEVKELFYTFPQVHGTGSER